jgi:hypothetical protein
VLGPEGRSVESEQAAALQHSVDDCLGQVVIVKDVTPSLGVLVGGEDHCAASYVSVVDDVIEDASRVVAVGEVADLVDDEHMRLDVAAERITELAVLACS